MSKSNDVPSGGREKVNQPAPAGAGEKKTQQKKAAVRDKHPAELQTVEQPEGDKERVEVQRRVSQVLDKCLEGWARSTGLGGGGRGGRHGRSGGPTGYSMMIEEAEQKVGELLQDPTFPKDFFRTAVSSKQVLVNQPVSSLQWGRYRLVARYIPGLQHMMIECEKQDLTVKERQGAEDGQKKARALDMVDRALRFAKNKVDVDIKTGLEERVEAAAREEISKVLADPAFPGMQYFYETYSRIDLKDHLVSLHVSRQGDLLVVKATEVWPGEDSAAFDPR